MPASFKFVYRRIIIRNLSVRRLSKDWSSAAPPGEKNPLKSAKELNTKGKIILIASENDFESIEANAQFKS